MGKSSPGNPHHSPSKRKDNDQKRRQRAILHNMAQGERHYAASAADAAEAAARAATRAANAEETFLAGGGSGQALAGAQTDAAAAAENALVWAGRARPKYNWPERWESDDWVSGGWYSSRG